MSRFKIERVEKPLGKSIDKYVILFDAETGNEAVIADRGCAIRQITFNYGTPSNRNLIKVMYDADDWVALKHGIVRAAGPVGDTELLKEAHQLRLTSPTLTEGTTIDVANRVEFGKAVCLDPNAKRFRGERQWKADFKPSNAQLHGKAQFYDFSPVDSSFVSNDENASVTYAVRVGKAIDYFSKVICYVTFSLTPVGLVEKGIIRNDDKYYAPIAFARHPSYRIGAEGLESHVLRMDVSGSLETDSTPGRVLNPTGFVVPLERTIFYDAATKTKRDQINLGEHHIDTTFLLGADKTIELINAATGYGLAIDIGDNETRMVTLWTNELPPERAPLNRQHVAIEPLVGTHGGMLSLPYREPWKDMTAEQILRELDPRLWQRVLAPGEALKYERTYRPVPIKNN